MLLGGGAGTAVDAEELVVETDKIGRGDGRADQCQAGFVHQRDDDGGHRAGDRSDHDLGFERDQLACGAHRLFAILPVVADHQFQHATIDAAGGILLFDREDHPVADAFAEIRAAVGEAGNQADHDWLLLAAGGQADEQKQQRQPSTDLSGHGPLLP